MLEVNSIALLTVSLNLATLVPLFTNMRLSFVGAENHNNAQWKAWYVDIVVKRFQNEIFFHGDLLSP